MYTEILREAGYEEAVRGIGLSYGITDFDRLERVAYKLADKNGGHNKFLESIQVWLEIRAPRYWWQEFDTYRVGTSKQSESTIHTLARKHLTKEDFVGPINDGWLLFLNSSIDGYNNCESKEEKLYFFRVIKNSLPEGFLQTRLVNTNYKCLRNMIWQRKKHILKEWRQFISVLEKLKHKKLLFKGFDKGEK